MRYDTFVKRIVYKARSFKQADAWSIRQELAMTPPQRIQAARVLKRRVWSRRSKDVRACHAIA